MTSEQKQKLKKIFDSLATPEERAALRQELTVNETKSAVAALEEQTENSAQLALKAIAKVRTDLKMERQGMNKATSEVTEAFKGIMGLLGQKLDGLREVLQKNPDDLKYFFKDFGEQIAKWGETSKNTEELIRNLKWNASQQLRNRDGSPINPAVDPFNIGGYDNVQLTYTGDNITTVTYSANGLTTAVLTLTYSGSNVTNVQRTQ